MAVKPDLVACVVLLAGTSLAVGSHVSVHSQLRGESAIDYRPVPPAVAKVVATDFDALWADLAWLAFLQHDGAVLTEPEDHRKFGDLDTGLRTVTTLDPDYLVAYLFGSWALGDAGQGEAAEALLLRGLKHRPGDRHLELQLGFVRFLVRRDVEGALAAFSTASRPATTPTDERMRHMAMRMAAGLAERRDDTKLARKLWEAIEEDARAKGDQRMEGVAKRALERLAREGSSVTASSPKDR
ncbi:MAG: hypothetical protein VKO21_03940 [Candidatus Sericytochromatia bacterium]|nr:hypothetical protein [Candidatus Sericytochromatia bacterium]